MTLRVNFDWSEYVVILIGALLFFMLVFVLSFAADAEKLWIPSMFVIIVLTGILIFIARFGGADGKDK